MSKPSTTAAITSTHDDDGADVPLAPGGSAAAGTATGTVTETATTRSRAMPTSLAASSPNVGMSTTASHAPPATAAATTAIPVVVAAGPAQTSVRPRTSACSGNNSANSAATGTVCSCVNTFDCTRSRSPAGSTATLAFSGATASDEIRSTANSISHSVSNRCSTRQG